MMDPGTLFFLVAIPALCAASLAVVFLSIRSEQRKRRWNKTGEE